MGVAVAQRKPLAELVEDYLSVGGAAEGLADRRTYLALQDWLVDVLEKLVLLVGFVVIAFLLTIHQEMKVALQLELVLGHLLNLLDMVMADEVQLAGYHWQENPM